jgi:hypothetical protein
MVDPNAAVWLSGRLPDWTKISVEPEAPPQTLSEIRDRTRQSGRLIAEPIPLDTTGTPPDLLIPILKERPSPCQERCLEIVELHVYQPLPRQWNQNQDERIYLAAQLAVNGPAESYAIAPLVNANAAAPGSTRPLPLTNLQQLTENTPGRGLWFNLVGERNEGDSRLNYGQVYHYNRDRYSWSLMLQWSSPAGQLPRWQSFTGDDVPELVVDRTVGLEPDFAVYQVQSRNFLLNPVQLVPIALNEPALDSRTYKNALLLARNGLWSDAEEILRSLQSSRGSQWTPEAQAQLDLVSFHADIVQTQAEASWASPSQKVLAALLDGRWQQARETVREFPDRIPDLVSMLSSDTSRIWQRIDAMVRVNPTEEDAILWGVAIKALQDGTPAGLDWLDAQENVSPETRERAEEFLIELQLL